MLYYNENLKWKGEKSIKKEKTTKDWLPYERILDCGIIKSQKSYIKILKVVPINYDLKSDLEKEAILNAYKIFLKTCEFNIQILVQSKKEDLSKHISNIQNIMSVEENPQILKISENYINYIKEKNNENKSSSKNFYIILSNEIPEDKQETEDNYERIAVNNLLEKFFKVKENLSRCGNLIQDVNSKKEIIEILKSFYNPRIAEK